MRLINNISIKNDPWVVVNYMHVYSDSEGMKNCLCNIIFGPLLKPDIYISNILCCQLWRQVNMFYFSVSPWKSCILTVQCCNDIIICIICVCCRMDMATPSCLNQIMNSQRTSHTLLSQSSYILSFVSTLQKKHVVKTFHCIKEISWNDWRF